MSTALSRSHSQEGLRGPGDTGVQPGGRGEPEILSHWTILRGVHFMPWCFISGGSHGWLFEQEKFLSHPSFSFSPYSLSPHCPKRSTCRSLNYIHRIYHYILKCCSIIFPQPQFYFQHTYPRVLILRFPVQVWIWSSGAKQLLWIGRVSDVHRRNKNISCAIQQLRFLSSFTQKHMAWPLLRNLGFEANPTLHEFSPGEKMLCLPVT